MNPPATNTAAELVAACRAEMAAMLASVRAFRADIADLLDVGNDYRPSGDPTIGGSAPTTTTQQDGPSMTDNITKRLGPDGWPYGPNVDHAARERLAEWLEQHDLHRAKGRDCWHWLRVGRCNVQQCDDVLGRGWTDHPSLWLHPKARVLVCHPYGMAPDWRAEIDALRAEQPTWTIDVQPSGWYGNGTHQVTIWAPRG